MELKKLLSVIAIFALMINSYTPAFADTVTHFGDGIGSDVPSLLDDVGIGSANAGSETTAEIFMIPGLFGLRYFRAFPRRFEKT